MLDSEAKSCEAGNLGTGNPQSNENAWRVRHVEWGFFVPATTLGRQHNAGF